MNDKDVRVSYYERDMSWRVKMPRRNGMIGDTSLLDENGNPATFWDKEVQDPHKLLEKMKRVDAKFSSF